MLKSSGVPQPGDLAACCPPEEERRRGALVRVECFQEIPCDPCHTACPTGAIGAFADINDIPAVDHALCTGCGVCIAACPGLAIFVVDESAPGETALVSLPYEFAPLPETGTRVALLDRGGEEIGRGEVRRVRNPRQFGRTAVITLAVPRELADEVRAFDFEGGESHDGR